MPLKRGFPHKANEKRKRFTWCPRCVEGRHVGCDLHMNDGAFDAMDFVHVSCECPCEGEIRESFSLLDLIARLRGDERNTTSVAQKEAQDRIAVENTLYEAADLIMVDLHNALIDDEGRFNPHQPTFDHVMARLEEILRDSEIPAIKQLFEDIEPA